MASFKFLMFHPVLSSCYFGGKGKLAKPNGKSFLPLFLTGKLLMEAGYQGLA